MKNSSIKLWEASDSDEDFLRELFYLDRAEPIQYLGRDTREKLLEQQYQTYSSHMASLSKVQDSIIVENETPIGRLIVQKEAKKWHVADICLHPNRRGKGIGTLLLLSMIKEAGFEQCPISVWVFQQNPCVRLYHRLGFKEEKEINGYVYMILPIVKSCELDIEKRLSHTRQ